MMRIIGVSGYVQMLLRIMRTLATIGFAVSPMEPIAPDGLGRLDATAKENGVLLPYIPDAVSKQQYMHWAISNAEGRTGRT